MSGPGRLSRLLPPVLLLVGTLLVACSSTTDVGSTYQASVVVRAFLYAGEPVTDIRLSWTTTLSSTDTIAAPINNADVTLIRGSVRYRLVLAPGDSGYYRYSGNDLTIHEGDVFQFEAHVGDQLVTAQTTVPTRPGTVAKSGDTVKVPDFSSFTPGPANGLLSRSPP